MLVPKLIWYILLRMYKFAGCANKTLSESCTSSLCSVYSVGQANHTRLCCCHGNMCNPKFSLTSSPHESYSSKYLSPLTQNSSNASQVFAAYSTSDPSKMIVIENLYVVLLCCILALVSLVGMVLYNSYFKTFLRNRNSDKRLGFEKNCDFHSLLPHQSMASTVECLPAEHLHFIEIIHKGNFASVWKCKLDDRIVAAKIVQNESSFHCKNELKIYKLAHMNHLSIPKFFGLSNTSNYDSCLLLECGNSSLENYLRNNVLNLPQLCTLTNSMVGGLVFLHTEITKQNRVIRPAIAHRALCSRNIIVRADGSCMICDFKFAIQLDDHQGSASVINSLCSDSVRYLSPEVLDDKMNLQRESALKQSDIYSLGILIWEVASRCSDLYQGIVVPAFKLPFENEVGLTPTFEQMKVLVSLKKARPLFPCIWKSSNLAIRLLKDTMNECWDSEPEARLTALCVEARFVEFATLWQRHKQETMANSCLVASHNNECCISNVENASSNAYSNCFINKFDNSLHYKYNNYQHLLHHPYKQYYNPSKLNSAKCNSSEKNVNSSPNNTAVKFSFPIQPYQARNPCSERNLMSNVVDEDVQLLEHGSKFRVPSYPNSLSDLSGGSQNVPFANISNLQSRSNVPMTIAYVQNSVGSEANRNRISFKSKETNKSCNATLFRPSTSRFSFSYLLHKFNLRNPRTTTDSGLMSVSPTNNCLTDERILSCHIGPSSADELATQKPPLLDPLSPISPSCDLASSTDITTTIESLSKPNSFSNLEHQQFSSQVGEPTVSTSQLDNNE